MKFFLLSVLFLLSGKYLYSQSNNIIKDVSPNGKQVLTYSSTSSNKHNAIITGNVPFGTQPDWQASLQRQVGGLAWADFDHDGDLDLGVGCYHSNSYPPINEYETEVYRNDNGTLTSLPAWTSTDMRSTTDIEWADINGDGLPDLLAANGDESLTSSVIYMNSPSGLDSVPSWISNDYNWTVGAAFGDVNGDGFIDLAFGNQGNSSVPDRPISIFYNVNGTLHTNPDYLSGDQMITNNVALADIDNSDLTEKTETFTGDGTSSAFMLSMVPIYKIDSVLINNNLMQNFCEDDLNGWISLGVKPSSGDQIIIKYRYMTKVDLAACKWTGYSSGVYFNNNGSLNGLPGWTVNNTNSQYGIAWADMDNDGYLDLAIGGSGYPAVVYKNNNGVLDSNPIWTSGSSNTSTQDLAWGDVNNDGYPDLAIAHFGYSKVEIYLNNNGILETNPSWTYTTASPATALSFGDLNGDGYLDLAIGTARTPVVVFLNNSAVPVELTSFSAVKKSNGVKLNWETATETNNSGFEIFRKENIENNKWEKIGFVKGHGTTADKNDYTFLDNDFLSGNYSYKLTQLDFDGSKHDSKIVNIEINTNPSDFVLMQNYPNPFNPSTVISYKIFEKSLVSLKVYDILGNEISQLVNRIEPAGKYNVTFNGKNLTSGIYFYKLEAGSFIQIKKMILLK